MQSTKPMATATVARGPNGGVEYRLWTGTDTFRVVSKYAVWHLLSDADREQANRIVAERRAVKARRAADDATWRYIRRGG